MRPMITTVFLLMAGLCLSNQFSNAAKLELELECHDQRQMPVFSGGVRLSKETVYGTVILRGEFFDNYGVGIAVCDQSEMDRNLKIKCTGFYQGGDRFRSELEKIDENYFLLHLQGSKFYRRGKFMRSIKCRMKR